MIKQALIFILPLLLLSCTTNKPQQLDQLPSWYVASQTSNDQNLYGVGEGYTLAEASKSALNNLAGKIITNISSKSSILLESNKYSTNEQSHQKINEEVAKITFNNYQINNSASFGGKIYVEIAVNRNSFIASYSQKLDDLNHKMANIFNQTQSKTILEKLSDLELINNLSFEAESITQILASLSDDQHNFKNNFNLYNSYHNSYQNLTSKIEFFIENKNAPQPFVALLIKNLNQKNLKVIKNKNLSNPNLVIVQINSKITKQKIYGSYITKLKIDFNLLSNNNRIIKSDSLESSGSSMISQKEATNVAIAHISEINLF